ncbi:protein-disulfide reductase DsbD domain-containing protein [Oceaniglobus ichthyenteri]|uniref:protein-disulfide reductase DsbD domain-containing protein n=1 Tax=Oceaniglobus ichthyenteri TaxID=2136177 RepID=UPI000D3C6EAA|nr:protein-disulfide reductase DsbD domain-containing protein [Oceaniglobus ichthyenteri]
MIKHAPIALCVSFVCALAAPVAALGPGDMATVDILPGWRTAQGTHMAAIRVTLAPGWKTYWRAPGDAGIPAQFDWHGSGNMGAVALHWPTPDVFYQNGMTSVGYHDQVILPVEITPRDAGAPIRMAGEINMGVCQDICVPITVQIAADLPAANGHKDARIRAALDDRPMTRRTAGVGQVTCAIAPARRGVAITATLQMPALGGDEFGVIELPGAPVWVSQAETTRQGNTLTVRADIVPDRGTSLALDRSRLRLTVLGQRGAVDIRGCD